MQCVSEKSSQRNAKVGTCTDLPLLSKCLNLLGQRLVLVSVYLPDSSQFLKGLSSLLSKKNIFPTEDFFFIKMKWLVSSKKCVSAQRHGVRD